MNPNNRPLITRLRSAPAWRADHRSRNRRSRAAFTLAKQRERVSAFTLVELLIATGITVAMVLMLGLMLGSLMSSASHATERVDAFRDARAALQTIERDLRNLVPTQWDVRTSPIPTPTPVPITRAAAYFALKDIYADPATAGNHNQHHAYSLRRFFRNSTDTFTVLQNAVGGYASDSVLYAPAASDAVLAAYIWNFKITMYNSAGTVINTYPYICDPNATTPNPLPAAIEIAFNAMSPQAARTVMSVSSSANDWMDTTTQTYQRLIAPHAYQFRSRINLP